MCVTCLIHVCDMTCLIHVFDVCGVTHTHMICHTHVNKSCYDKSAASAARAYLTQLLQG